MLQANVGNLPLALLSVTENAADNIPISVVVVIGILLVFFILLILIIVIMVQGSIFSSIEKKKQEAVKPVADTATQKEVAPVAEMQAVQAVAAPVVEDGISPEVVAAISAAVSTFGEGVYTLRSVATAQAPAKKTRSAWGMAGVIQTTEPF